VTAARGERRGRADRGARDDRDDARAQHDQAARDEPAEKTKI
jgi:hypothetical protein